MGNIRSASELFFGYFFRPADAEVSYHESFTDHLSWFTHENGTMSHSQLSAGSAKMNYGCWIRLKLALSREFFFWAM
jgi:hypothetical protein